MRKHLLILFLLVFQITYAQSDYELKGYVKTLGSAQKATGIDWLYEGILHNRLDFSYYQGANFTFNASMRNRFFVSDNALLIPNYADFLMSDNTYFDLNFELFSNNSLVGLSQFDRLNFDFYLGDLQVTVGRQRINWGQTFVWNPNDLFNSYSFFDFDYEERPGSDAVRLQYYLNEDSKLEWSSNVNSNGDISSLLLYKFNNWGYDFQFISGMYNQSDFVAGLGLSGSIYGGAFSSELTFYNPYGQARDSTSANVVASVNYIYTINNELNVQFEFLYNGFAKNNSSSGLGDVVIADLDPKNLFPYQYSIFANVAYNFTPLLSGNFGGIYSPEDNFYYIGPSLMYSLSNSIELAAFGQYYSVDDSSNGVNDGLMLFTRLKWSF